jgi:hypothetical protein
LGCATAYRRYGVGENVATYTAGPLAQPAVSARSRCATESREGIVQVRPGSLRVFQRVLIPVLRAVIHVPVELATCLHVDVVCPQAADSHSPASSIVPERLSEDAVSVFQRRLTVRGGQGFVAIATFSSSPDFTRRTSATPSSRGIRDCRRSSDRP